MRVPDYPKAARRRLIDRIAPRLPFGPQWTYVSLWLRRVQISPGVEKVVPWLMLYVERPERTYSIPLMRLPGAKLVELWDPTRDEWLVDVA